MLRVSPRRLDAPAAVTGGIVREPTRRGGADEGQQQIRRGTAIQVYPAQRAFADGGVCARLLPRAEEGVSCLSSHSDAKNEMCVKPSALRAHPEAEHSAIAF